MYIGNQYPTIDVFNEYVKDVHTKELDVETKKIYIDSKKRVVGLKSKFNYWKIYEYDINDKLTFMQDSDGNWEKRKYMNKQLIQFSSSNGTYWSKNKE